MSKTDGKDTPKRGDVYWVNFDPTIGTEVKKTRPAIILSNNLFNKYLPRLLVVPITSNAAKVYDFDAAVVIEGKKGKAMLDQMRAIDKNRLGKKLGCITPDEMKDVERAIKEALALA